MGDSCSTHASGRRDVHIEFWCGNLRVRRHLEDLCVDGRIMLKVIVKQSVGRDWSGSVWLRIGTGDAVMNLRVP